MSGNGQKSYLWAGAAIFFGALLIRVIPDLIFFLRNGWFSSHLIEVWFYYGVARGVFYLSWLDPTFLLLRLPGLILPESILYQVTVFSAALVSALTAWLLYGWLRRRWGEAAGIFAGLTFALLPAPITLCLVNFSHDLVAIPLIVLFFWAVTEVNPGSAVRVRPLAAVLIFFLLGLMVGPLMVGALLVVLISYLGLLPQRLSGRPAGVIFFAFCLGGLVLISSGLFWLLKPNLLNWLAPLALRFRGIDLTAQMLIQVGDLQPFPPDAFWNRYTIFVFLLPWGLWTAFRRRDFFTLSLFLISLTLALVVNRAARLLDLSVVLLSALALADWKRPAVWVTAIGALLLLSGNIFFPEAARTVYAGVPLGLKDLFGKFLGGLFSSGEGLNPTRLRFARILIAFFTLGLISPWLLHKAWAKRVILVLAVFLQAAWVLEVAGTSSDPSEYRAYRWLDARSQPGEKIFAAWNQGYFIGSVTDLKPITTPQQIDPSLYQLYWEEEDSAVEELARRGVDYVHVSGRYFGITTVNRKADTFGMRGSTIIGPQPNHIRRFSRMRQTLLFRMLYEPDSLRSLKTIYEDTDPRTRLLVRIFQLAPLGEE